MCVYIYIYIYIYIVRTTKAFNEEKANSLMRGDKNTNCYVTVFQPSLIQDVELYFLSL